MGPDRTRPTTEQAEARLLADIANARSERDAKSALFAAAPDLLAACKEVRDFFDGDFAPEMKGHTATLAGKMFSTLATALANAEGNPTT